jgi:gamma-aminobutyric acid receptor subunit beta
MRNSLSPGRLLGLIAVFMMIVPATAEAGRCPVVPKYGAFERPDREGEQTRVFFGIFVIDLAKIDDVDQTFRADFMLEMKWKDPRLAHGKAGGPKCILNLDEVWQPYVIIVNQRELKKAFNDVVEIDGLGNVLYIQRLHGELTMPLDLRDFPFDQQTLRITAVSTVYGPDELILVLDESMAGREERLSIADWSVGRWAGETTVFYFEPAALDLSGFEYELEVARQPGYYFLRAIIPMMMIIFVSWTVFWLDPSHLGTQIGLSATVIVVLFIFQLKLGDILPRVSYLTRTDHFVLGSQLLVILALVEAVASGTLATAGNQALARKIDRLSRWVFPALFAALVIFAFLV